MSKLIIPPTQKPKGEVRVSGAKNSATRLMCAALLSNQESVLNNFPTELVDARNKAQFFNKVGIKIEWSSLDNKLAIESSEMVYPEEEESVDFFNVPVRTTYLLAAAQLMRFGKAKIPIPGGCKLGDRKYDLHIMVWEKFGCKVEERDNYIYADLEGKKLKPCQIEFPLTTVGGTENALLCASVVQGTTIIKNAYVSPEVYDLIKMIRQMGAKINLLGNSAIEITGSNVLRGVNFEVMPDRIEALTWLVYGALSRGDILIKDVPFDSMKIPLTHIVNSEIDYFANKESIFITENCINKYGIQPFELACGTHPGIISDMQPFYVLLGLQAQGRSLIIDYRYPNRTAYLDELNKFLINKISYEPGKIEVNGPTEFKSAKANSTDLRGSMAVIMAALLSSDDKNSVISNPELALRGYNKLLEKLGNLGIVVKYVK